MNKIEKNKLYSKRKFLTHGLGLIAGSGLSLGSIKAITAVDNTKKWENSDLLRIPPLLKIKNGRMLFIDSSSAQYDFKIEKSGYYQDVLGFNGKYLGPTIMVDNKSFLKLNLTNNLKQELNFNIHGMQIESHIMGNLRKPIKPKETFSPVIPITQNACCCLYSAYTIGHSSAQTYFGLYGMMIINDEIQKKLPLPKKYGVNDFPLLLQDANFDSNNKLSFNLNKYNFSGTTLLTNGQINPSIEVEKDWVRLRIANASISRRYFISLSDGGEFSILASDQGLIAQTKNVTHTSIAPGERLEILVNMQKRDKVQLLSSKSQSFWHKISEIFSFSKLDNNVILNIYSKGQASLFNQTNYTYQNHLLKFPQAQKTRSISLDPKEALINNKKLDLRTINIVADYKSSEIWVLKTTTPTTFFIQGAVFKVLFDGVDDENNPILSEQQLDAIKDTIWVEQHMIIQVFFTQKSSQNYPFLFGINDKASADRGALATLLIQ